MMRSMSRTLRCVQTTDKVVIRSFTTEEKRVLVKDVGDGIKHVQLNRASKRNSLDMNMFETISRTIRELRSDTQLRAVILSGKGKAFCTGLDIKSMIPNLTEIGRFKQNIDQLLTRHERNEDGSDSSETELKPEESEDGERSLLPLCNLAQEVAYEWRNIPCPTICSIDGDCFGGGLQIALGCDMRFTTKESRFSLMEAKWGLIPDMSASVTLRSLVRMDIAKELAMTGRVISGTDAAELGLATRCVDDPMKESLQVAREMVERSPDSIAATKVLLQTAWQASEKDALLLETDIQRKLVGSSNQMIAVGRNIGVKVPYTRRSKW